MYIIFHNKVNKMLNPVILFIVNWRSSAWVSRALDVTSQFCLFSVVISLTFPLGTNSNIPHISPISYSSPASSISSSSAPYLTFLLSSQSAKTVVFKHFDRRTPLDSWKLMTSKNPFLGGYPQGITYSEMLNIFKMILCPIYFHWRENITRAEFMCY